MPDNCPVCDKPTSEHRDPCIGATITYATTKRRGKSVEITSHEGVVKKLRTVRQALVVEGRTATWVVLREETDNAN